MLDPNELIQRVVDMIRERFDLYYAGLFLVDQTSGRAGRWAVLRAGTGEAGNKMAEQRYELRVCEGHSMIGECIATGEARVEQDVGKAAVHRRNPLLPDTRSELALPLISRGEAIGALTVQSAEPLAFTEEDISILQTMAGQVANAIENTRLFKQTEDALKELEAIHHSYIRQSWDSYLNRGR
jgi:GAF domain-containing protein